MAFNATRVAEAALPELLVAGGVAVANLITRALDAKAGRTKTISMWNTYSGIICCVFFIHNIGEKRNSADGMSGRGFRNSHG